MVQNVNYSKARHMFKNIQVKLIELKTMFLNQCYIRLLLYMLYYAMFFESEK